MPLVCAVDWAGGLQQLLFGAERALLARYVRAACHARQARGTSSIALFCGMVGSTAVLGFHTV